MMKLYKGDCLIENEKIESGSVDLILTDLPFGTMIRTGDTDKHIKKMRSKLMWDLPIEPKKVFEIANRILRKNGKMILFSQEPYTTKLITEAIPNIPFNYRATWEKDNFAVALGAAVNMVSFTEDVLVFSKGDCYNAVNPLKNVMKKYESIYGRGKIINLFLNEGRYKSANSAIVHASYKFGYGKGMRFDLMNEKMYNYLSDFIDFKETFEELKKIDNEYKIKYCSTFNLWEGKKHKSNILKYKKDYSGHHPTQKPVLLLEDLIKTFSNEGDNVVDLTMGSGSTGVACVNTKRNFIGIEQDNSYFITAEERIKSAGFLQ